MIFSSECYGLRGSGCVVRGVRVSINGVELGVCSSSGVQEGIIRKLWI